jgi:hypothetical protein
MKTLYWKKPGKGRDWLFTAPLGTPARAPIGRIMYLSGNRHYAASCEDYSRGVYIYATARTFAGARARLEREIDKRSIALFGEDIIEFVREPDYPEARW